MGDGTLLLLGHLLFLLVLFSSITTVDPKSRKVHAPISSVRRRTGLARAIMSGRSSFPNRTSPPSSPLPQLKANQGQKQLRRLFWCENPIKKDTWALMFP